MKKIYIIMLFLLSITIVNAKDNKLYFSDDGKEMIYDSALYDEEYFMKHLNLSPGVVNKDVLIIENGSKSTCELYLKVIEREQNDLADELLENILMKVYVDDNMVYNGTTFGEDITGDGINLQSSILIGEYKPNTSSKLVAVTQLNENYSNIENKEQAYIDWQFYAKCAQAEVKPINPDTGDFMSDNIFYILIVIIILAMFIFVYSRNKLRTNK